MVVVVVVVVVGREPWSWVAGAGASVAVSPETLREGRLIDDCLAVDATGVDVPDDVRVPGAVGDGRHLGGDHAFAVGVDRGLLELDRATVIGDNRRSLIDDGGAVSGAMVSVTMVGSVTSTGAGRGSGAVCGPSPAP